MGTPQGGSQAEALRLRCDKCVVRDADIRSLQDTLLWDGRLYGSAKSGLGKLRFFRLLSGLGNRNHASDGIHDSRHRASRRLVIQAP
jgi:hypothetical protein